ncbi:MAG: hypothetical protein R2755_28640 [Acidimicrobiales bacterium]
MALVMVTFSTTAVASVGIPPRFVVMTQWAVPSRKGSVRRVSASRLGSTAWNRAPAT